MPLKSRLVSVIGDDERFVSSIDVVVGEPTTAAALRRRRRLGQRQQGVAGDVDVDRARVRVGAAPVKENAQAAVRRPSPAPSVGENSIAIVHDPPPPGTTRVGQLSAPILKSVVSETV